MSDLSDRSITDAVHAAADLVLEIVDGMEDRAVRPAATRDELEARFRDTLRDRGAGLEEVLGEFRNAVLPNTMGTGHPLYLGLVNSNPLLGGVIADLLISAVNQNAAAHRQSLALHAVEREVVRAFADLFRMPPEADGLILPGGQFGNLQGVLMAREAAFPGQPPPPSARFYGAAGAHTSIQRALRFTGFAPECYAPVPGKPRGELDIDELARRIAEDRDKGLSPFGVVGTMGTSGTGSVDPMRELAELCEREGLWFHIDACYGGASALLPEPPYDLDAVGKADSLATDPHKWFFVPATACMFLHRHPDVSRRLFVGDEAKYIRPYPDGSEPWQMGLPCTRRASGFAVWMTLRVHGWDAIREAVTRNIECMRYLEELLEGRGFAVMPGGQLSIACARWEPDDVPPDRLDELQDAIQRRVEASGRAWFATTAHGGKVYLRFNAVNHRTRRHHIDEFAELLLEASRASADELKRKAGA